MEYQFGFRLTSVIFNDFKWIVKATRCVILWKSKVMFWNISDLMNFMS